MNNYPEYVEVENRRYKINTDFRYAIECNKVAEDKNIGDFERALAVIYLLFGDEGINNPNDYEALLKLGLKYLACGKEINSKANEKPDMDFIEDYAYIKTSFRSDFGMNIDKEKLHWWEFMDLMNGLSNSEFGNCCILNRIRNFRNFDLSQIKDKKERKKAAEEQERIQLKKYKKENQITKEQERSMLELNKKLGL